MEKMVHEWGRMEKDLIWPWAKGDTGPDAPSHLTSAHPVRKWREGETVGGILGKAFIPCGYVHTGKQVSLNVVGCLTTSAFTSLISYMQQPSQVLSEGPCFSTNSVLEAYEGKASLLTDSSVCSLLSPLQPATAARSHLLTSSSGLVSILAVFLGRVSF